MGTPPNLRNFEEVANLVEVNFNCFTPELKKFIRKYFACASIDEKLLDVVVEYCTDYNAQDAFVTSVFASPIWNQFSEKSQCHTKVIKYVIKQLEKKGADICDGLYQSLVASLNMQNGFGHRIYMDSSFAKFIALKERNEQLSRGTTGLSCWQASCDLAHYLLGLGSSLLSGRDVLELGAGCGLAGIVAAASGLPKSVTLTDHKDEVLQLIEENCRANFFEVQLDKLKISVKCLDWEDGTISGLLEMPNLIIASDVMFDRQLAASFASLIKKLMRESQNGTSECIIAGVIRNEETHAKFLSEFGKCGLVVSSTFTYSDGKFCDQDGKCTEDISLFDFSSSICVPTTFLRLCLAS